MARSFLFLSVEERVSVYIQLQIYEYKRLFTYNTDRAGLDPHLRFSNSLYLNQILIYNRVVYRNLSIYVQIIIYYITKKLIRIFYDCYIYHLQKERAG